MHTRLEKEISQSMKELKKRWLKKITHIHTLSRVKLATINNDYINCRLVQ